MRTLFACAWAVLVTSACALAQGPDDLYQLGPDSEHHEGIPQGKIVGPLTLASEVYPNTTRQYWVYVPAQYNATQPASLMVFFDGHAYVGLNGPYRIPHVFDNLIFRKEMPVTLGVFINPPSRKSTTSPIIPKIGPSPGLARVPSAPSPSPGTAPISSAR